MCMCSHFYAVGTTPAFIIMTLIPNTLLHVFTIATAIISFNETYALKSHILLVN